MGVIYRVAYNGDAKKAKSAATTPADVMVAQAKKGADVPLALDRPETETQGKNHRLYRGVLEQPAIPAKYSEYADGVSPALKWSAVPKAASYAIVMEDPDSSLLKPFCSLVGLEHPGYSHDASRGLCRNSFALSNPRVFCRVATHRERTAISGQSRLLATSRTTITFRSSHSTP